MLRLSRSSLVRPVDEVLGALTSRSSSLVSPPSVTPGCTRSTILNSLAAAIDAPGLSQFDVLCGSVASTPSRTGPTIFVIRVQIGAKRFDTLVSIRRGTMRSPEEFPSSQSSGAHHLHPCRYRRGSRPRPRHRGPAHISNRVSAECVRDGDTPFNAALRLDLASVTDHALALR